MGLCTEYVVATTGRSESWLPKPCIISPPRCRTTWPIQVNRHGFSLSLAQKPFFLTSYTQLIKSFVVLLFLFGRQVNHWCMSDLKHLRISVYTFFNVCMRITKSWTVFPVLPQLLPMANGMDMHTRHGAILACAEITHALYKLSSQDNKSAFFHITLHYPQQMLSSNAGFSPYTQMCG